VSVCVVCGQLCVPMADYDQPVCIRCDSVREVAQEVHRRNPQAVDAPIENPRIPALQRLAATVTAETYGRLVPEYHNNRNDELAALQKPQPPLRVIEGGAA
jgi:hypothetical protein